MVYPRRLVFLALPMLLAGTSLTACVEETGGPATTIALQATVVRPPLATPASTPTPVPPLSPSPSPAARTYTVRSGDTLTGIAGQMYGDADQWRIIFEANRDRLTAADQLQVGQELRIPPLPGR